MELCGVRTENCPPGMKTGDQISPPGGYVGGGLQMQTDLAIGPAGDVWVMNNWQDIDSCFGNPPEGLSTRCGGQGVAIFLRHGQASSRATDRPCQTTVKLGCCPCDRRRGQFAENQGHTFDAKESGKEP